MPEYISSWLVNVGGTAPLAWLAASSVASTVSPCPSARTLWKPPTSRAAAPAPAGATSSRAAATRRAPVVDRAAHAFAGRWIADARRRTPDRHRGSAPGRSRRVVSGAARRPPAGAWAARSATSIADREHGFEVVLRVRLERDHGLRAHDPVDLRDARRDDVGEVLVPAYVHDRDEVPLAGDRVRLAHALDVGEHAAERRHRVALGLDQDDRVGHGEKLSPGFRTWTLADVSLSTSDLNASASVSIGGKGS